MSLKIANKGVFVTAVSQFGVAYSFNFIMAFIPFYIIKISSFGTKETMIWTGLIMGGPHLMTALTAPFWGDLTSRFRPKVIYEWGFLCHGLLILLMAFTESLYILLLLRFIQGIFGGVSTIGMVIITVHSQEGRLHEDLSLFQNSITAGHLIGPPIGAYAASLFGYKTSFVLASVVVFIFLFFCHRYVSDVPRQERISKPNAPYKKKLLLGWCLGLIATIHLTFLPSILPAILEGFKLKGNVALNLAGIIIMSYTFTAFIGTYVFSRVSSKLGPKKVIAGVCLSASFLQLLLFFSGGIWTFIVIRMLQTAFVAAVFPLTMSIFARDIGGGMIGFLNSGRFVGIAVGPLMATSILAYSNLFTLYALIAGFTLVVLWGFLGATKPQET